MCVTRRNSKKERAFYEAIMCDPRDDTTLIAEHERSSLPLTLHSLKTLRDGVWLNDEIINTSMALLQVCVCVCVCMCARKRARVYVRSVVGV